MAQVTDLIERARGGDRAASDQLFTEVYGCLHEVAARLLRRVGRGQVDAPRATSLVHEAYFRLASPKALNVADRVHLYAVAGRAMRQLVIDRARQRQADKRGGGKDLPLDELLDHGAFAESLGASRDDDVFALEQALAALAKLEPGLVQLVELRFYAGMELREIAELVGRSERSLKRDWRRARAFLIAQLGGPAPATPKVPSEDSQP